MIHKTFIEVEGKRVAWVTFSLPSSIWADRITLVGDFNGWDTRSHSFERTRAGTWLITIDLDLGRAYQFRYLQGDDQWINDPAADAHVHNTYGSDNFVVITDPEYARHADVKKTIVEERSEDRTRYLEQHGRQRDRRPASRAPFNSHP